MIIINDLYRISSDEGTYIYKGDEMGTIDFTDYLYDAQQGDQSAIRFIYDNTIQLFYKEADAIMQDKDEADKAIRDAYVFIFEHLDSLEDPS